MTDNTHTETTTQLDKADALSAQSSQGDDKEVDVEETQAVSEDTVDNGGTSQVEDSTNPTTNANDDESSEPTQGDDESDDDAMVPLKKLREVRREAKNLRDRLKVAEDRIVDLESREGDEALVRERDELKSQLETLVNQNRQTKLEALVTKAAETANAIQADVIVHLIDSSKVDWKDDTPTNVDALVADVKKNYSRLFGTTAKGNAGNRNERHSEHEGLTPTARMRQAFSENS